MLLIFIVFVPMLPLISSWQWDWWEAWVYAAVNIFGFVISRYLAGCRNPDLLVECSQFLQHPNLEKWDKTLSPLLGSARVGLHRSSILCTNTIIVSDRTFILFDFVLYQS
jgi:hypothetical protein